VATTSTSARCYANRTGPADLFAEEQERVSAHLAALDGTDEERKVEQDDITQQFERVAEILSESTSINSGLLQQTPSRKALLDEYISRFNMYVDQLKVEVRGAPKINMPYTK
jgi:hypothetical protein